MPAAARALGMLLLAAGTAGILFLVWQLWWTDVRAESHAQSLISEIRVALDQHQDIPAVGPDLPLPAADGVIVHLPTLGEELPVLPGVGADVLDQGILGHYPGTAQAGDIGNFAVAGHRTTYGRPLWALDELEPGDEIVVETASAFHVYAVRGQRVVTPEEVSVLAAVPDQPGTPPTEATMVLTTCHPRFSARERLVAYAVLVHSVPREDGPPAVIDAEGEPPDAGSGRVP